jgi:hypothetical protein
VVAAGHDETGPPASPGCLVRPEDRFAHQLFDRVDAKFLLNVAPVRLDRFHADVEPIGYFSGRKAEPNFLEHLQLAIGHALNGALRPATSPGVLAKDPSL